MNKNHNAYYVHNGVHVLKVRIMNGCMDRQALYSVFEDLLNKIYIKLHVTVHVWHIRNIYVASFGKLRDMTFNVQ